jgi:sugar O-acyltransferase (sialic acid O-acetyltransferase NeuD family)
MKKILVVGGGGHAKVLISIIKKLKEYEVLGYTDFNDNGKILDVNYLGKDEGLADILHSNPNCYAAIGIGGGEINYKRKEIFDYLKKIGFNLPCIASPNAIINEEVSIGEGSVIFDGAIINAYSEIGVGVIVNTNTTVEHDCKIGDYVHIAPGVTINGGVKIGNYSFIGAGATIIQYKTIGEDCIIGAGAVVIDDCLKSGRYVNVPARLIL